MLIPLQYDYQILLMQKYGGISRYFYEIIKRFPDNEFKVDFPVIYNQNSYFAEYFRSDIKSIKDGKKRQRIVGKNQKLTCKNLKKKSDDVIFHPTYYNPYFIDKLEGKLVVTVHDMIHEKFPEYYGGNATIVHKKLLVNRADAIVAVSGNTKKELLEIYPDIPEDKIAVIYHGNEQNMDEIHSAKYEDKYLDGNKIILYVGNRDRYKNFIIFAKSMMKLMSTRDDLKLVCVGGGAFNEEEEAIFTSAGYLNRVIQTSASDEELTWLYQNAECFVFPSKAEGFGIPILEAWRNECPVVLADIPCFREVAYDAALFFDPDDSAEILSTIEKALNKDKQREIVSLGKSRLSRFTWDNCANAHADIYRQLYGVH